MALTGNLRAAEYFMNQKIKEWSKGEQFVKILTRLAVIFAVYCSAGAMPAAAATDLDAWISSDGRIVPSAELHLGATRGVSHGYKGLAAEGLADQSLATVDTEEEYAALLRRKVKTATGSLESAETVLGNDLRSRFYTGTYPHTAIGLITFDQGIFSFICTGWLINANTVATAGHCVHEGFNGNFSTNIVFIPGKDGGSNPFGTCAGSSPFTVVGWAVNGLETFDYGAFKVACNIGNTVGWFGFWWQGTTLNNQHALITGYPGDLGGTTQWGAFGFIKPTQARQLFYFNDSFGGMSGSPIYQPDRVGNFCQGTCAMGIHAYGIHGLAPHGDHNHGTRIVQAVFNNLLAWRTAPP
jgi:glutamyl endopeptidase